MTPTQDKALEYLSKVQYMTLAQMIEMDVFKSESTARRHLKDLVERGFLNVQNFGVQVGVGKLPSLYGLTPKSVQYIADNFYISPENIKISKSHKEIRAYRDFYHRVGLIDSLLAIYRYLESLNTADIWSELYFRKHGEHAKKRTAIDLLDGSRLEPDAILHFTDPIANRKRLYLIEFYEDSEQVERIRRALIRHGEAIATGKPSEALNLTVGHRVLLIFRHEHTARAISRYLQEAEEFRAIQDRFLITTHNAIKFNPFENWIDGKGENLTLF